MDFHCCGIRRRKSETHPEAELIVDEHVTNDSDERSPSFKVTLNGVQGRRSLPDVVLPSTGIEFAPDRLSKYRHSVQFANYSGRRTTIDLETTACLAKAESLSCTADSPQLDLLNACFQTPRAHSLKILDTTFDQTDLVPRSSISSSPSKQGSMVRLLSFKLLKSKYRRKSSVNHKITSLSNVKLNGNHETNSSSDKLGQLPPVGRFRNYNTGYDATNVFRQPLSMRNDNRYRRGSLCISSHLDEPIVTPFAQILASLRRIRNNLVPLALKSGSKECRSSSGSTGQTISPLSAKSDSQEHLKINGNEILEELDWCLERLESIQTHRSVGDMATNKFRKMLNKELNQSNDNPKSKQISEYICSTFFDAKENDAAVIDTPIGEQAVEDDKLVEVDEEENESPTHRVLPVKNTMTTSMSSKLDKPGIQNLRVSDDTSIGSGGVVEGIDVAHVLSKDLVPFGVISKQPERLSKMITESLDCWGMDTFELSKLTENPLTCVFYNILQKRGLIKRFNIPEQKLVRYMSQLELHYQDNPYHNRLHAADVTQSSHVLLKADSIATIFTDLEVLSILFASAIHDVDHPGLTNQYLINTNNQLAILYNDSSVLENHHLAVAFQIFNKKGCDMFENIPKKQRLNLRRMTIDMVLATDMSKHMNVLADLKTMVETRRVAGSGIVNLDNYSDRMQILQNMIHCADLSNPTKPLELYRQWNSRVMEEHFRQGDRERAMGLDISPMCDRTTASLESTQVSFIDYIVHPLWETWSELVYPDAQQILDTLDENREWYLKLVDEKQQQGTNKREE